VIGEGLIENLLVYLYQERSRLRLLSARVVGRSKDMRVAFSALLRIEHEGRYVLVRNLHRPESFGPFGGVIKYHPEAKQELDRCEFAPQVLDLDMKHDLRGFLPEKHAAKLYAWYNERVNRELADACLRRELREELQEVGLSSRVKVPRDLRVQLVRRVVEGPEVRPGHEYRQFRIFEVYDPILDTKGAKAMSKEIVKAASAHKDLVLASPQEIRIGRCQTGELLGHHCCYLLWERPLRQETPAFPEAVSPASIQHKK
jgi:hypothetical protein